MNWWTSYRYNNTSPMASSMRIGRWEWSWYYLELIQWNKHNTRGLAHFRLRCYYCEKLTLGCSKHWFCGCCQSCWKDIEEEGD